MTVKHLKRPRDPVQLGKLVGDILTGQVDDHQPAHEDQNADATELSRQDGIKAGRTPKEGGKKDRQ